jgi:hypothetical protein
MTNRTTLPSQNTAYGFYGTVTTCPLRDCTSAVFWTSASTLIAEAVNALGEAEMIGIRDFLDSKMGRHFADEVIDALRSGETNTKAALKTTIDKWQRRGISAQTEASHGIPEGLPHLDGWVTHYAILAETDDAS